MAACLKTWESCLALRNLLQIVDTAILLSYPHHYHFQSSLYDNQHTSDTSIITIPADQQFSAKKQKEIIRTSSHSSSTGSFFRQISRSGGFELLSTFQLGRDSSSAAGAKKYDHQQGELHISASASASWAAEQGAIATLGAAELFSVDKDSRDLTSETAATVFPRNDEEARNSVKRWIIQPPCRP